MPEYVYKAITSKGQVVSNKVEDVNKNTLIKRLKNNDFTTYKHYTSRIFKS